MSQHTDAAAILTRVTARHGSVFALRDISLRIPKGRTTVFLGHEGAGKSTLLNVLAELHRPSAGDVYRRHFRRAALVGHYSQLTADLPLTVRQTVAMGRWAHRHPWRRMTGQDWTVVTRCLRRLGIAELFDQPLSELSDGQRQLVLLAQGLAQDSDLLLLDEASAGLDTAAMDCFTTVLAQLRKQKVTVVHATHDAATAARADHCVVLADGRQVADDLPAAPRLTGLTRRYSRRAHRLEV